MSSNEQSLGTPSPNRHKLVGVIGSGQIGLTPFDRQSWSGLSYYFFTECQNQGLLHRAFGVEAPRWKRYALMAKNYSRHRRLWRTKYYMDPQYRDALTKEIRDRILPDDLNYSFLQIGAMYDVPALLHNKAKCFSYHDGNMAQSLRSPNAVPGLSTAAIDRGLAYERSVYHKMTRIFAMSEYLRRSFIEDFGVPAERVVSVGAGINMEVPEYVEGKRYDRRQILFIGVDFARKGGWELLQAFKVLRERFPDASLHIVGPRTLTIPPELQAGVEYHGFLRKEDPIGGPKLAQLLRDSTLFVMPSHYEPFGVAPLEAMVHQIPCLVTNDWALRESVVAGSTGDLVECKNVPDLVAKLNDLLSDPQKLFRMGEASRQRVLDYFLWDKVVERIGVVIGTT